MSMFLPQDNIGLFSQIKLLINVSGKHHFSFNMNKLRDLDRDFPFPEKNSFLDFPIENIVLFPFRNSLSHCVLINGKWTCNKANRKFTGCLIR